MTDASGEVHNVLPLFDSQLLTEERGRFFERMKLTAPTNVLQHKRAVDQASSAAVIAQSAHKYAGPAGGVYKGPSVTGMLWQRVTSSSVLSAGITEFLRLVKLGLTMVGTSVENERVFSSKTFLDNDLRPLKDEHLNVCLRAFKSKGHYTLESFPYGRAFKIWREEKDRRMTNWTVDDD